MKNMFDFKSLDLLDKNLEEHDTPYILIYRNKDARQQWRIQFSGDKSDLIFAVCTIILEVAKSIDTDVDAFIYMIKDMIDYGVVYMGTTPSEDINEERWEKEKMDIANAILKIALSNGNKENK